jgi:hypothetical protein
VRGRARAHHLRISSARACACAPLKFFRVRGRARAHVFKFSGARARTCAPVRAGAFLFLEFLYLNNNKMMKGCHKNRYKLISELSYSQDDNRHTKIVGGNPCLTGT